MIYLTNIDIMSRTYKIKASLLDGYPTRLTESLKSNPGSYVDSLYENLRLVYVIVFSTSEDCLAFTLKYGDYYV